MARGIEPDRQHDDLLLGRLLDRNSYSRDSHDVQEGNSRFDIVREKDGVLVIGEIKKSSRAREASRMQLAHYLYELSKDGIYAEGELLFPKEKKRERVILDDALKGILDKA
ncbi:MAG: CRISPR-associated protein Cas4, partial [Synergistales bacterium 58_81]